MFLLLFCLISSFNVEQITSNNQSEWVPTVAVDESCKVHIAYTYPDQIHYITNKSGLWEIDSILVSGSIPSIAVTPGGTPHIVYIDNDGNDDEVYYATYVGGNWDIDTVTNNSSSSKVASIALAPDSIPHVVYYDFTGGLKIWHAVKNLGTWTTEFIPGSNIGTYSSIAVDSSGKVHVAFVAGTYGGNREIIYANDTSGSWVTDSVTIDALDDDFPSIAVDMNRNVHIVFSKDDGSDWELWYATNESGSFVATQLTDNVGIQDLGYPSIAVDENCCAHIAHQENYVAGNFFYFTNLTGSWERETIFTGSWNKTYSWVDRNICIDNLGYVHVCFANQTSSSSSSTEIYHAMSDESVGIENLSSSLCPQGSILVQLNPNPFKEKVIIKYKTLNNQNQEDISLRIFDITGRLVKDISLPTAYSLLPTVITWDGGDNSGSEVQNGIYFLKVKYGEFEESIKLLKIK